MPSLPVGEMPGLLVNHRLLSPTLQSSLSPLESKLSSMPALVAWSIPCYHGKINYLDKAGGESGDNEGGSLLHSMIAAAIKYESIRPLLCRYGKSLSKCSPSAQRVSILHFTALSAVNCGL